MAGVCHRTADIERLDVAPDLKVAALAARQHGVVEFGQLRRLGLGPGAIRHRAQTGRLHRLHRGVYAVGRASVPREGLWTAAVLACGPDAVLSHRSAAAHWGLLPDARAWIDVTVSGRRRASSGHIAVHNVRRLHADDRAEQDGVPVTSVARTLLDLAEVVSPRRLARAVGEAERLGSFDLREVQALCERSRGCRGVGRLTEAVRRYEPAAPFTRSGLERRLAELCERARLPRPAMNLYVAGHEVDAAWLDRGLVVEVDSFEFHRTRAAFEADRRRDAALQREGLRVLRVSDRRLDEDPAGVADDLRALLRS